MLTTYKLLGSWAEACGQKIYHLYVLDIEDKYHTVVFKLGSAFKWISDASKFNGNNLEWILKLDDDVLLDVNELKKFIDQIRQDRLNSIFCHVKSADPPMRNKDIDKQYG